MAFEGKRSADNFCQSLLGLTFSKPSWMSVALWARGTRSIKMSEMSRRMARVVSSTRKAKRNVQIGSTMLQRGSSCTVQSCEFHAFHIPYFFCHVLMPVASCWLAKLQRADLLDPDNSPCHCNSQTLDEVSNNMKHCPVQVYVPGSLTWMANEDKDSRNLLTSESCRQNILILDEDRKCIAYTGAIPVIHG